MAISDTIPNLVESVLQLQIKKQHVDKDKQFGFKPNSSCSHAVFVINQAIKWSKLKKRKLYICAIDASKAFDKINRIILWAILIDLKINKYVIKGLMNYYHGSMMLISNNDQYSSLFKTHCGCRQGGTISPMLFSLYAETY